jgi:hypothetical protein
MKSKSSIQSVEFATIIILSSVLLQKPCSSFGQTSEATRQVSEVKINVIEENRILRDYEIRNPNELRLATGENLAVAIRGDKLKVVPDTIRPPGLINLTGRKYKLPESYLARLRDGTTTFLEIILICKSNLVLDRSDLRYHGFLTFQLVNMNDDSGSSSALVNPISLTLHSGSLVTLIPDSFELDRINSLIHIECTGKKQLSDSADVKIVTPIKKGGYQYYMSIEPYLELNMTKDTIMGLGIQEAILSVMFSGSESNDSIQVSVDATLGTVKPNIQYIKFNEIAKFNIRSENLGYAEVEVVSNFETLKVSIFYKFPWLYLVLPMIGGILGASAKTYDEKPIKLKKLLVGAILGLIGAIAWYALGINLIGIEMNALLNELAAFGIGATLALLGVRKSHPNIPAPNP